MRKIFQLVPAGLTLALALVLALDPAVAQQTDRAKRLGAKLMCMCGCNQVLTQCNHVGCRVSASMLKELDLAVARNESDDLTLQSFVQAYGQTALAEPPSKGFSGLAWYIPGIAFGVGLVIVVLVIGAWRRRLIAAPAGPAEAGASAEFLDRARRQADEETEEL